MAEVATEREIDLQRALVGRILASSHLNKSARLTDLFQYLCARSLDADVHEIHELELGHKVFGRAERYDTTADNIVRVHASLLRKRLAEYFQAEGRDEEFSIEIPRGNYAPLFRRRNSRSVGLVESVQAEAFSETVSLTRLGVQVLPVEPLSHSAIASTASRARWIGWMWPGLAVAFALLSAGLFLRLQHVKAANEATPLTKGTLQQFWSGVFRGREPVDVVMDDASVSFYQEATGQPIPINDYFDRSYLRLMNIGPNVAVNDANWLHQLIIKRQSTYANSAMVWKLSQIAGALHSDAKLQFARDLSFRQMKSDSLVLLGSPASDPWIQLFEGNLSLHWKYDPTAKAFFPIDTTTPGDENRYHALEDIKTREGYATISFLPNLGGTGNVLIVSGTGGAATDAVMDWLMDEHSLQLLRGKLPQPQSAVFPYFEALLKIEKGIDRPRNVTITLCRALRSPKPGTVAAETHPH